MPLTTNQMALLLTLLAAALILLSIFFVRRRRNVWKRFARRHRLQYSPTPEVRGTVGGRFVSLYQSERSSDTGLLGIQEVTMAVELNIPVPRGLRVKRGGVFAEAGKLLGTEDMETGDPEFDRQALIQTEDPQGLRQFLTPTRRRALLDLLELGPLARMEGNRIALTEREMISSLDHLESKFMAMLQIARSLET